MRFITVRSARVGSPPSGHGNYRVATGVGAEVAGSRRRRMRWVLRRLVDEFAHADLTSSCWSFIDARDGGDATLRE